MATITEKMTNILLAKPYWKFRKTNDITDELSNPDILLKTKVNLNEYYFLAVLITFIPPFIFGIIGLLAIYYLLDNKSIFIITDKKIMKITSRLFKKEYSIVEIDISTIEYIYYKKGLITLIRKAIGALPFSIYFKEDNQLMAYGFPPLKNSKAIINLIRSKINKTNA